MKENSLLQGVCELYKQAYQLACRTRIVFLISSLVKDVLYPEVDKENWTNKRT